jgi:hypothetical protein
MKAANFVISGENEYEKRKITYEEYKRSVKQKDKR